MNRFRMLSTFLLLLTSGACSDSGQNPPTDVVISGPNQVAQELTHAMVANDCGKVADMSTGVLHDYYVTLERMRGILLQVSQSFEELYPEEKEAPSLLKLKNAWRVPMTYYKDMHLDGALSVEEESQERRYAISWVNPEGAHEKGVLIVVQANGDWRVSSLGLKSPRAETLGSLRTQLNYLEFTWQEAMKQVREAKLGTLREAHLLFTRVRKEMSQDR